MSLSPKIFCAYVARILLFLQIFLATWLCSGTRTEHFVPMFIVSVLLFLTTNLSGYFSDIKSPFLKTLTISTFAFIILAVIQYFNVYAEFIKLEDYSYTKNFDFIKYLPSSVKAPFDNGNALSALTVLLTAFLTTISAYAIFNKSIRFTYVSIYWFIANAVCMGIFAICQRLYGFPFMYNIPSLTSMGAFYGSFFLENAAGTFLNMAFASSLFCVMYVFKKSKLLSLIFFTVAIALSISVYFSKSNAAILLMIFQWIIFGLTTSYIITRKYIHLPVFVGIVTISILIGIISLGFTDFVLKHKENLNVNERLKIYEYSCDIIEKRPILGWGGDCSQYVFPKFYLTSQSNKKLYEVPQHSHSDILEYLLTYGIVGAIFLFSAGISWLAEIFKYRKYFRPQNCMLLGGTLCCIFHSAVDMELHILATMIVFGLMSVFTISTVRGNNDV